MLQQMEPVTKKRKMNNVMSHDVEGTIPTPPQSQTITPTGGSPTNLEFYTGFCEDQPTLTKAEEQGLGKGEALFSLVAAKLDREMIEVGKFDDDNTGDLRILTVRSSTSPDPDIFQEMDDYFSCFCLLGVSENCVAHEISEFRMLALNGITEALTCCDFNTIGVCGPHATEKANLSNLLEKISRRAKRDELFDVVVMATVTHKPNNKRIQDEIAEALGFKFDDEDLAKRAKRLRDRILIEQKILVILCDLCKGLDLDKVGIPFGADHTGCKVSLTSTSEEVLSNEMFAQKIFKF